MVSLTPSVTQTPAGLRGLMAPAGLGFGLSGGCWHGCQAAPPSDCWHQGCWEGRRMAASRLRSSSASGSLCLSGSSRLSRDNLKVHRLLKQRESSYICEEQRYLQAWAASAGRTTPYPAAGPPRGPRFPRCRACQPRCPRFQVDHQGSGGHVQHGRPGCQRLSAFKEVDIDQRHCQAQDGVGY